MAKYVTVTSGAKNGTSAADTLWSKEAEYTESIDTWTTTVYAGINGLDGDDYLDNVVAQVKIDGGADNDQIYNYAAAVTIVGSGGNDRIDNYNYNFTTYMKSGAEATGIYVGNNSISIDGGEGDDVIINGSYDYFSNNSTVRGGNGNDNISTDGNNVLIDGGDGNDSIGCTGAMSNNVTVDAGAGNDYIGNSVSKSSLVGGDGDDTIKAIGTDNTLRGGNGNDRLSYDGSNNKSSVKSNILMDDTIGNNYFSAYYANNVTINGGSGADTVNGYYITNTAINIGAGDNSVTIGGQSNDFTITAAGGNDSISVGEYAKNFSINAGDGANYVRISNRYEDAASYYTVNSGSGNDYVFNSGNHAIISTGAGDDTIMNSYNHNLAPSNTISAYNLIDAGAGNDSIRNDASNVTITGGAGNDTIVITDYYYADIKSENVLINYVSGDGNDIIIGFDEDDTLKIVGGTYSSVISGSDVILTVGNDSITLNGATTVSTLNIIGEEGEDTTPADSKTLILTDSDKSAVTIGSEVEIADASARTKAIKIYGNDSANTIIGGSGNDKIWGENGDDLFVYTSGKDIINDYDDGDKISLTSAYSSASIKGDDVIFTFDSKNNLTVKDSASKIIKFADGTTFGGSSGISTTLTLTDADKSSVTLNSGVEIADASARTKSIKIYGNDLANTIIGGSGNDRFWGEGGDDLFVYSAGKDIINDYDDGDTISLASSYSSASIKGDDVIFTFDSKNSLTVKDSASKIIKFADGTTFGGEISDSKTLTLTNADKSSVTLGSGVEVADASARTKSIKIYGNDLANTIIGGSGNDKFWGEDGDDTFVYTSGKDIINDYDDGDKISLASAYSSASIKGDDVIFTFDSKNSLTVKDSADKIIKFADGTTFGGSSGISTTLTLTDADKSSVTLGSGVEIADASARTKSIKIYGNDLANTIIGGSGNDKFWGEGGDDTFIYSDGGGKDYVYDFGDDDLLEIVGEFSASYKKSTGDVVFKVGDGSITLKDTSATIFNVNGENYHISGTKLVK